MRHLALAALLGICGCSGSGTTREDYTFYPLEDSGESKSPAPRRAAPDPGKPMTLDLLGAMRLAGAENIDISVMRTRLEARRAETDEAFQGVSDSTENSVEVHTFAPCWCWCSG